MDLPIEATASTEFTSLVNGHIDDKFLQGRTLNQLPRIFSLLTDLYGHSHDIDRLTIELLEVMNTQFMHRDTELKLLDIERSHDERWFCKENALAYVAYVDRFADNLVGVERRIGHLKQLGVSYLHLLPFLKARQGENDGGFAVSDFSLVDPSLGNNEQLRQLTHTLRKNNISLCCDFVLNHIADDHPWVQSAKQGDTHYKNFFHLVNSPEEVQDFEKNLNQIFPETAPGNFTWIPELEQYAWTTFYPYQWDLNFSNPKVLIKIIEAMLHLTNMGIEIFRLDSVAYLWKKKNTRCVNLPEVHQVLQILRAVVDIVTPGVLLKAEAIMPTQDLPPFFGMHPDVPGKECRLAYHSSLMSALWVSMSEQNASLVGTVIENTSKLPNDSAWLNYVRCHDDIGWNVLLPDLHDDKQRLSAASRFYSGQSQHSYAQGKSFQALSENHVHGTNGMLANLLGLYHPDFLDQQLEAVSRIALLFGITMTVGGIPLIYMGDEFGLSQSDHLDTHIFAAEDGRRIHRPFWDEEVANNSKNPDTVNGQVFKAVQHLISARKQTIVLGSNGFAIRLAYEDNRVLVIERSSSSGRVICLFNFSASPIRIDFDQLGLSVSSTSTILAHPLTADCDSNQELAPWGQRWLKVLNT